MIKTGTSDVSPNAFIILDVEFASELRAFGISDTVIAALKITMRHMTKGMDEFGYTYSRTMRQTLIEYGLSGVKDQTAHMIKRMRKWKGSEANQCRRILRNWAKQ